MSYQYYTIKFGLAASILWGVLGYLAFNFPDFPYLLVVFGAILNFPALIISFLLGGHNPSLAALMIFVPVQWFLIGYCISRNKNNKK